MDLGEDKRQGMEGPCSVRGRWRELDRSWGEWDPVWCLLSFMSNPAELAALLSRTYRSPTLVIRQALQLYMWVKFLVGSLESMLGHPIWPGSGLCLTHSSWPHPSLRILTLPLSSAPDFRLLRAASESCLSWVSSSVSPTVHELLEIMGHVEELMNVMDTLRKMHTTFTCSFAVFQQGHRSLKPQA